MQQRDPSVDTRFGVDHFVETRYSEAECVASLTAVHVVAERQDDFEQFAQLATVDEFLAGLETHCGLGRQERRKLYYNTMHQKYILVSIILFL